MCLLGQNKANQIREPCKDHVHLRFQRWISNGSHSELGSKHLKTRRKKTKIQFTGKCSKLNNIYNGGANLCQLIYCTLIAHKNKDISILFFLACQILESSQSRKMSVCPQRGCWYVGATNKPFSTQLLPNGDFPDQATKMLEYFTQMNMSFHLKL